MFEIAFLDIALDFDTAQSGSMLLRRYSFNLLSDFVISPSLVPNYPPSLFY